MLEYINSNLEFFLPAAIGFVFLMLLLMFIMIWNYWRIVRGLRAYRQILERFGDRDIEDQLSGLLREVEDFAERLNAVERRSESQEQLVAAHSEHLKTVVQQVGLIRYNAFPDVAGDQSYSLALLDKYGDGVILTTLHGRLEARTYAKKVIRGTSNYPLLPEEQQAIYLAVQSGRGETASVAGREAASTTLDKRAYLLGRREEMAAYQHVVQAAEGKAETTPAASREAAEDVVSDVPLPELQVLAAELGEKTASTIHETSGGSAAPERESITDWPADQQVAPPPWAGQDPAGMKRMRPFGSRDSDTMRGFPAQQRQEMPPGAISVPPDDAEDETPQ